MRVCRRGTVLFLWKNKVGSSNVGSTQVDGGSEGSYANGRVCKWKGANFERFYHGSSTGNWGFCFDDWWNDGRLSLVTTGIKRVCQKGKSFAEEEAARE